MDRRVVITGLGLISPLGESSRALFEALCNGHSGIRPFGPEFRGGCECHVAARLLDFRPEKYLSGRPLRPLDRVSQLAAAACGLAIQSSGWNSADPSADLSLVVGTMFGGMHTIGEFDRTAIVSGPASVSPMAFANTVISAAAGQTAIWHHLSGVNSTVATGTTSGISAIALGADLIRQGGSRAILAGGVDEFSVESFYGFGRAGLLCKNDNGSEVPIPFHQYRNGFAIGEGAGFLLLEDMQGAVERQAPILAEVKGYATTFDRSRGKDPTTAMQTLGRAMSNAITRSQLAPEDIDFVSSSANGSVAADCFELTALASFFGERSRDLPVAAIKYAIGEALGASGPLQIAAAIETLQGGRLPGVFGLQLPPGCPLQGVLDRTQTISAQQALINGVGLDGSCGSLVIALPV